MVSGLPDGFLHNGHEALKALVRQSSESLYVKVMEEPRFNSEPCMRTLLGAACSLTSPKGRVKKWDAGREGRVAAMPAKTPAKTPAKRGLIR